MNFKYAIIFRLVFFFFHCLWSNFLSHFFWFRKRNILNRLLRNLYRIFRFYIHRFNLFLRCDHIFFRLFHFHYRSFHLLLYHVYNNLFYRFGNRFFFLFCKGRFSFVQTFQINFPYRFKFRTRAFGHNCFYNLFFFFCLCRHFFKAIN